VETFICFIYYYQLPILLFKRLFNNKYDCQNQQSRNAAAFIGV